MVAERYISIWSEKVVNLLGNGLLHFGIAFALDTFGLDVEVAIIALHEEEFEEQIEREAQVAGHGLSVRRTYALECTSRCHHG